MIGFEPVTTNSQPTKNKELTAKPKTATAQKLPKSCNSDIKSIAENCPDLEQIVTVWPSLPEHIKAAIKALVKTYQSEKK